MVYREEQRVFQSWLLSSVLVLLAGIAWWGFIQQVVLGKLWGSNPGPDWVLWVMLLVFGMGFPAILMSMRLVVEVHEDHLDIRFAPLARRKIAFREIERAKARTYRPIAEYGGWGIKGWSSRRMAYSVSGNQGVDVQLRDGRSVLLGSREAKKLERSIEQAMRRATPPV